MFVFSALSEPLFTVRFHMTVILTGERRSRTEWKACPERSRRPTTLNLSKNVSENFLVERVVENLAVS